jgi:hypothetical protein
LQVVAGASGLEHGEGAKFGIKEKFAGLDGIWLRIRLCYYYY